MGVRLLGSPPLSRFTAIREAYMNETMTDLSRRQVLVGMGTAMLAAAAAPLPAEPMYATGGIVEMAPALVGENGHGGFCVPPDLAKELMSKVFTRNEIISFENLAPSGCTWSHAES